MIKVTQLMAQGILMDTGNWDVFLAGCLFLPLCSEINSDNRKAGKGTQLIPLCPPSFPPNVTIFPHYLITLPPSDPWRVSQQLLPPPLVSVGDFPKTRIFLQSHRTVIKSHSIDTGGRVLSNLHNLFRCTQRLHLCPLQQK